MHVECYFFCGSTTHLPALQIRASEETITEQKKRVTWEGEQAQEKSLPHSSLARRTSAALGDGAQHHNPQERRQRTGDGAEDRRSSDLCAGRRRRNSVSLLYCAGQKENSGRTGEAGNGNGKAGMGWDRGGSPRTQKIPRYTEKSSPGRRVET